MTALPTRKLEAYRYADIDALASVWSELAQPERVEIAAQQKLQQIWLPSGDEIEIQRIEMILKAGATARIFALNNASRYGRIELDVTLHEGAEFSFNAANIGGGNSTRRMSISSPLGSQICCSFCCAAISTRSGCASSLHTDANASMSA